jgi:hypothetical protein
MPPIVALAASMILGGVKCSFDSELWCGFDISSLPVLEVDVDSPPTFVDGVLDVVFLRPNKQVRRIAADWIVASVQNEHALWNNAPSVKLIGRTMGKDNSSSLAAYLEVPIGKRPMVCLGLPRPSPWPTCIFPSGLINLGPETVWQGDSDLPLLWVTLVKLPNAAVVRIAHPMYTGHVSACLIW